MRSLTFKLRCWVLDPSQRLARRSGSQKSNRREKANHFDWDRYVSGLAPCPGTEWGCLLQDNDCDGKSRLCCHLAHTAGQQSFRCRRNRFVILVSSDIHQLCAITSATNSNNGRRPAQSVSQAIADPRFSLVSDTILGYANMKLAHTVDESTFITSEAALSTIFHWFGCLCDVFQASVHACNICSYGARCRSTPGWV